MTKKDAEIQYNDIVAQNLKSIPEDKEKIEIKKIEDPDKVSHYTDTIAGVQIEISQDGLCGCAVIRDFSDDFIKDYKLIREEMFGTLFWPTFAISINQLRYSKFKDRIDLLLNDISRFYEIVDENTQLTDDIVKKIWEKCDLARAYLFPYTFIWLRSFKNLSGFCEKDKKNISCFLPTEIGKPWDNTGTGITKEYYDELLKRIKEYKAQP